MNIINPCIERTFRGHNCPFYTMSVRCNTDKCEWCSTRYLKKQVSEIENEVDNDSLRS